MAPKAALPSITFTCGVSGVRLLTRVGVYHLYNCANASLQLGLRNIPGRGGHVCPNKPPAVGFHPLVGQSWVLEVQETKPKVKRTCPAQPLGELSEAVWVLSPMLEESWRKRECLEGGVGQLQPMSMSSYHESQAIKLCRPASSSSPRETSKIQAPGRPESLVTYPKSA